MDSLPFFSAIIAVTWLIIWFVRQDKKPSDEQIDGVFAMRRPVKQPGVADRPRRSLGQREDPARKQGGNASATSRGGSRTKPPTGGHLR